MRWLVMRFKRLKRITEQQSSKSRPVTEPPVIHTDLIPLMRGAWLVRPCHAHCGLLYIALLAQSSWLCSGPHLIAESSLHFQPYDNVEGGPKCLYVAVIVQGIEHTLSAPSDATTFQP